MDSKLNKIKRPKRQQKPVEDHWDCSVCTFKNNVEAVSLNLSGYFVNIRISHSYVDFWHNIDA